MFLQKCRHRHVGYSASCVEEPFCVLQVTQYLCSDPLILKVNSEHSLDSFPSKFVPDVLFAALCSFPTTAEGFWVGARTEGSRMGSGKSKMLIQEEFGDWTGNLSRGWVQG